MVNINNICRKYRNIELLGIDVYGIDVFKLKIRKPSEREKSDRKKKIKELSIDNTIIRLKSHKGKDSIFSFRFRMVDLKFGYHIHRASLPIVLVFSKYGDILNSITRGHDELINQGFINDSQKSYVHNTEEQLKYLINERFEEVEKKILRELENELRQSPKGEFETTEQYHARIGTFSETKIREKYKKKITNARKRIDNEILSTLERIYTFEIEDPNLVLGKI